MRYSAALHLAGRELAERRRYLAAALVLGAIPFALAQFPSGFRPEDVRAAVAWLVALVYCAPLAFIGGMAAIAGDLSSGRIAFYLARPVSGRALWLGKLLGLVSATLLSLLAILTPTALVDGARLVELWQHVPLDWLRLAAFASPLLLVIWGQALGVALSSRSLLLLLDAVLAIGAAFAVATTQHRLSEAALWPTQRNLFDTERLTLLAGVSLAAALATAVAVAAGRLSSKRAHRALSLVFWSVTLPACALHAAYAHWVVSIEPGEYQTLELVEPAPAGPWAFVVGGAPRRALGAHLVNLESGQSVSTQTYSNCLSFSGDGARAAWILEPDNSERTLWTMDLRAPASAPIRLQLALPEGRIRKLALSDEGRLLALLTTDRLQVFDLGSSRILASTPLPMDESAGWIARQDQLRFSAHDRLMLLQHVSCVDSGCTLEVLELDLGSSRLERLTRLPGLLKRWSPSAERLVVANSTFRLEGGTLRDTRSGSTLAELPTATDARFLADGRLVVATDDAQGFRLALFSSDGERQQDVGEGVPTYGDWHLLGPEIDPGQLLVTCGDVTWIVALDTGEVIASFQDLKPAPWPPWSFSHARSPRPGSLGARLFVTRDRQLLELDPTAGETRPLLGSAGNVVFGP